MALFAVLSVSYTITATGVELVVITDVACHLWMRWSLTPWDVHLVSEPVRGTSFSTKPYYCIVAYEDNEQEEAGDTLEHTFIKEPWAHCETRYFHFWGEIGGLPCPSESCLLEYHRVYTEPPPPTEFEHYEGNPDFTGYIYLNRREGQTFTPQVSHHISSVKLLLRKVGTPGPLHVYIYPTTDGKPSGGLLCEGQIDAAIISEAPNYTWKEITLGAGADLLIDVMYAITAYAWSDFGPWHNIQWGIRSFGLDYPRGHRVYSSDGGTTWGIWDYDSNFSVWGYLT